MSSSIFEILGISAEDLRWKDLGLCNGEDPDRFFEDYESSPRVAQVTDEMCLSCPVRQQCLRAGVEGNETGVWGGVYLVNGRADENRNMHKTKEVWDEIRSSI